MSDGVERRAPDSVMRARLCMEPSFCAILTDPVRVWGFHSEGATGVYQTSAAYVILGMATER
jgi:hypothetical protein